MGSDVFLLLLHLDGRWLSWGGNVLTLLSDVWEELFAAHLSDCALWQSDTSDEQGYSSHRSVCCGMALTLVLNSDFMYVFIRFLQVRHFITQTDKLLFLTIHS